MNKEIEVVKAIQELPSTTLDRLDLLDDLDVLSCLPPLKL